jgi:hypothetical protein
MRNTFMLLSALGLLLGCGGGQDRSAEGDAGAMGDQPTTDTMASTSTASTDTVGDANLTWGPAPPALPSGAKVAVVSGDPSKPGPFTLRIDMPPDYAVRPHHHPTIEELRVIEGTFHLGHGPKWDEKAFETVAPDQLVSMQAKQPHFVHAASRVLLELKSTGPFEFTYVDPKDDPRKGSTP